MKQAMYYLAITHSQTMRSQIIIQMKKILLLIGFALTIGIIDANAQHNRVSVNGQEIFASGMNLAWVNFAQDLNNFNETKFTQALDDIANAGGNSMRWWVHVNGTDSPTFTNGMVSGISDTEIANVKKVLDLAEERNIAISLCLWSFDMLQSDQGVNFQQNLNLLQNKSFTNAYIENALVPMVKELKGHPAILCWEIFNEPEGMTSEFGWTPAEYRTSMKYVQQFINLTAGAIHREHPEAIVSNGSWSFKASSDIGSYKNYYSDDELIAAGSDTLGTLDFYMVHYYDWGGQALSPFHHSASYWELDKPIVIAEFSAKSPINGVTTQEAYEGLYEDGYAGALSWTWTNHDGHGGIDDATPGMQSLISKYPEDIKLTLNPDFNYAPALVNSIKDVTILQGTTDSIDHVDLSTIFYDMEDSTALNFEIAKNTNTDLVFVEITDSKSINLFFETDKYGSATITVKATDSGDKSTETTFLVNVINLETENKALHKIVTVSSTDLSTNSETYAVDGNTTTRWSSEYTNSEWIAVDLMAPFDISTVILRWEVAYGKSYDIQVSDDKTNWQTVYSEDNSDGETDVITFEPVNTQYIRMLGKSRATAWGYSLYEFEAYENHVSSAQSTKHNELNKLSIFPNPLNNYATVSFQLIQTSPVNITITNHIGAQIEHITTSELLPGTHNLHLDTSNFNNGVYFLTIHTNNYTNTSRFVKYNL